MGDATFALSLIYTANNSLVLTSCSNIVTAVSKLTVPDAVLLQGLVEINIVILNTQAKRVELHVHNVPPVGHLMRTNRWAGLGPTAFVSPSGSICGSPSPVAGLAQSGSVDADYGLRFWSLDPGPVAAAAGEYTHVDKHSIFTLHTLRPFSDI